jgi:hypothetical protein
MLAIPDTSAHVTKLADWLELNALSNPEGLIGFGTLISASEMSEEEQPEDISDDDTSGETLVLSVQAEIQRRQEAIGHDYPFRIAENGQSIHVVGATSDTGTAYLFCLFLSHAGDRTIVPKKLAPRMTNKVRNLFQACATVAAGGFVQGTAVSFGWPRTNRKQFLIEVKRVYALFGDGTPVNRPRPAAPAGVKDDGIDIIAWRPAADGLAGTQYLIGQVASGRDWKDKSVVVDSAHFHEYWFKVRPACKHQDAMFMPFCLEPIPTDKSASYEEVLKDHMQDLTIRYGNLFYRYRIARYVAEGMRLHAEGQHIDGPESFGEILRWVKRYRKRLAAAA